jgi:hypothetical protein
MRLIAEGTYNNGHTLVLHRQDPDEQRLLLSTLDELKQGTTRNNNPLVLVKFTLIAREAP